MAHLEAGKLVGWGYRRGQGGRACGGGGMDMGGLMGVVWAEVKDDETV